MDNSFYTYAYLRKDGTPYYIGKGKGYRAYSKSRKVPRPVEDSRIVILKQNLTEEEAFRHERYMIHLYGRKDTGTGVLWNFTEGGEGISGYKMPKSVRKRIGESNKGKVRSNKTRDQISSSVKGFEWYNNGLESIQARSHPGDGWEKGRILGWETPRSKGMKWYHKNGKRKMFKEDPGDGWEKGMPKPKGKKYYNNGSEHVLAYECPGEGWIPGRLKKR